MRKKERRSDRQMFILEKLILFNDFEKECILDHTVISSSNPAVKSMIDWIYM